MASLVLACLSLCTLAAGVRSAPATLPVLGNGHGRALRSAAAGGASMEPFEVRRRGARAHPIAPPRAQASGRRRPSARAAVHGRGAGL